MPTLRLDDRLVSALVEQVVNRCLDEDINVFKHTIQDVVDELEVRCQVALRLEHLALTVGLICG